MNEPFIVRCRTLSERDRFKEYLKEKGYSSQGTYLIPDCSIFVHPLELTFMIYPNHIAKANIEEGYKEVLWNEFETWLK